MEVLLDMVLTQSFGECLASTDCSVNKELYPSLVYLRGTIIVVEMTGCLHHISKCTYPREDLDLASNHWRQRPARAAKLAHADSSDKAGTAESLGLGDYRSHRFACKAGVRAARGGLDIAQRCRHHFGSTSITDGAWVFALASLEGC